MGNWHNAFNLIAAAAESENIAFSQSDDNRLAANAFPDKNSSERRPPHLQPPPWHHISVGVETELFAFAALSSAEAFRNDGRVRSKN